MRRASRIGPGERLGERVEEHVLALPRAQPADHARPGTAPTSAAAPAAGPAPPGTRRRCGARPSGSVDLVASELAMIAVGTTRDAVRTIFTTDAGW